MKTFRFFPAATYTRPIAFAEAHVRCAYLKAMFAVTFPEHPTNNEAGRQYVT